METKIRRAKPYEKSIKKLLSEKDAIKVEDEIAKNPFSWPIVRNTHGVRKARFARDSMGKNGGGRICYYYLTIHQTVYFLSAYAKNDQDDLSGQDIKALKRDVEGILQNIGE